MLSCCGLVRSDVCGCAGTASVGMGCLGAYATLALHGTSSVGWVLLGERTSEGAAGWAPGVWPGASGRSGLLFGWWQGVHKAAPASTVDLPTGMGVKPAACGVCSLQSSRRMASPS
jgi:hypothetical protein